jgi:hypothetical protein
MGWELNDHGQSIDGPLKDDIPGGPCGISLQHLFRAGWFLTVGLVSGLQPAKHFVQRVKQDSIDVTAMGGQPLQHSNEIVNLDIPGYDRSSRPPYWHDRFGQGPVARTTHRTGGGP